ncbi:hypothetical protein NA57DRAFT_43719 [Rhizodiscina lignyota]|uniref:Mitochondrial carrier n=1 Tax=Rhizodiscina lignyota TaxID=1504668 RepID=A0A9P4M3Z8_9PEZI|nr:hypothetical protein NA57DRAFT_43719 [Rhizodiscina lignyota]
MTTSSDAPNPLRPYYIPPSVGLPPDPVPPGNASTPSKYPSRSLSPPRTKTSSFRSSAREYLSDLDYGDYLPERSPSISEYVKKLMDQAIWNYTSVLLAQPFEVAKTILQVHLATGLTPGAPQSSYYQVEEPETEANPYHSDESDNDSPSYFTSVPLRESSYSSSSHAYPTPSSHPSSQYHDHDYDDRNPPSRSHSTTPTPNSSRAQAALKDHKIHLRRSDAVLEVIGQLWQKEAAWGVWKGTNATFMYNLLLRTLESWIRSVLAALINLPESATLSMGGAGLAASAGAAAGAAGSLDILDSPNPLAALGVAVAAAGITGLLLSPLDVVRTRLIVTPTTSQPRTIPPSIRLLPPFLSLQKALFPITLLHSTIPSLFSNSAPIVLRSVFGLDPVITPGSYSVASFGAAVGELFVRLPLETVLRRGQVAVLQAESRRRIDVVRREQLNSFREGGRGRSRETSKNRTDEQELKTVVDVGPYRGVLGSLWFIVREEGISVVGSGSNAKAKALSVTKTRKGQGVNGLWRGWRVGFGGLLGVWGAAALNSGPVGTEF